MRYSKGVCWVDDTRIPYINEIPNIGGRANHGRGDGYGFAAIHDEIKPNTQGRFTPNLLVCDDMLNDGIKPNKGHRSKSKVTGYGEFGGGKSEYYGKGEYMEVDSKSRYYDLDMWFNKMIEQL